jgi:DNA polymerase III delta prime subunit
MNWLNTHKPKSCKDLKTNVNEVKKALSWIENYRKKGSNAKRVLFIIGPTGVGKTLLAELLFNDYNYTKIELNSSDTRSQKKIGEFLKKSLTYKNVVDMFNEGQSPVGILIDEIDTLCKLSDKGGFTEFLSILKMNEKYELNRRNILEKKKVKKLKILVEDYIKLYNPIICTSNDINDKKIMELKKYSEIINLKKPLNEELYLVIDELLEKYNQKIDLKAKTELCNYSQGDIRRLIMLLEDLHYFSKNEKITASMFEKYKKIYDFKEEDIQLIDSTRLLLTKKMPIIESQIYFDIDCLLTPLMIYHNSLDFIKNSDDTAKKKLNIYKNVLQSLCIHDTIQTNIFEMQDWDELYDISSIYGATIPNYYFNELKRTKNNKVDIQFTSLLNKISQMYTNKKLVNGSKFTLGKLNIDNDEIIYISELMSLFFDKYKFSSDNDDEDDCDDAEDANDANDEESTELCSDKKIFTNNSELINFMNKYSISIDGLENVLKIEKLNLTNEKRKKKFTLKLKKEISKYLTTLP